MGLTKEELRKSFLAKRKKLLDNTHAEKSLAIAQQCVNLPLWNRSIFHLFLPMQHLNLNSSIRRVCLFLTKIVI